MNKIEKIDNYNKKSFEDIKHICKNSEISVFDHFVDVDKMVQIGSGAERKQKVTKKQS